MAGVGQAPEIWIGIDLGTTYSCVAVWQHNRVDIIPNDHCHRTTPSYVSFTKYDRLVGETAASQATSNPLNTIFGAKRLIGRQFNDVNLQKESEVCPYEVVYGNESSNQSRPIILVDYLGKKKMFTPEAISAMILAKLKGIAEAYLGCPVNNAVISVPAMFNNSQRQATKDAGIIAGFKGIRLINEPTAVAMTYNLDMKINGQSGGKKNVLVFDLGGGTLDVSLVATENGNIEVKAVSGDTHLGGADFDNRIVTEFVKAFKKKHKKDISKNVKALARLRVASERAKKELSLLPQADVQIDSLFENIDFSASITRSQFEKLNNDLFHKCIEKVVQCLKHAEIIDTREVHDVVLVGGSSRIPKLTQMLQRFFNGKELCKSVHPDEAVAYGAALYAASLSSGGTTNNDIIIGGKTPLSLGFCHDNGNLQIVIPTNTTFPTRKTIFSRDNIDDQSRHGVRVWEEAETNSKTVNILGVLEFSVFPPAPTTSLKLEVCFEIDVDGILEVSAKQITTMNHCGQLTKADVNQLINEAEDYKARDEKRVALLQAKSKLESYANGISEQLMTDPCNTDNNIDAKKIKEYIDSEIEWLDSSADVSDITVFEKRLKELQRICEDLKKLQSVRGDHGELQSDLGDRREQKSDCGVRREQQSDRGVRREQQSDRGVRREQQSDRGVRREQQSDRGDRREHQGDHREPRQPQSDRGDRREHQSDRVDPKQPQSDRGDCREHQSNRGDCRLQQSDRGVGKNKVFSVLVEIPTCKNN